jgi:hypothetical protein
MTIAKLCEQYGFTSESMPNYIKIKSKNDIWYVEKGQDFTKAEIELFHENPIDRQDLRKNITYRNNFNINQNSIWHKQKTKKMTIDEVFEYINGHDSKYSA